MTHTINAYLPLHSYKQGAGRPTTITVDKNSLPGLYYLTTVYLRLMYRFSIEKTSQPLCEQMPSGHETELGFAIENCSVSIVMRELKIDFCI